MDAIPWFSTREGRELLTHFMLPTCLSADFGVQRPVENHWHIKPHDVCVPLQCVRIENSLPTGEYGFLCFLFMQMMKLYHEHEMLIFIFSSQVFFFFLIYSDPCDSVYPCSQLKFGCCSFALIIALTILHCLYLKLTFPKPNSSHCRCPCLFFLFFPTNVHFNWKHMTLLRLKPLSNITKESFSNLTFLWTVF